MCWTSVFGWTSARTPWSAPRPGATRFYASDDLEAAQRITISLAAGARLEWLPLEALAYPGGRALNQLTATLAPGAEMLAWDVTALGLPASDQAFSRGRITQRLELPGLWLEQAHIDASDHRLHSSPLGLARQRCLGSLLFAVGEPLERKRREHLLEAVRSALQSLPQGVQAATTCPNPQLLLVRALALVRAHQHSACAKKGVCTKRQSGAAEVDCAPKLTPRSMRWATPLAFT